MKFLAILLILFCGSNFVSAAERDAAITEAELVRRTQELYDAVVPGNQAPWKKYFAEDSIFADEKGRTMDKTKLVADITPMPAGYSGAIKIEQVRDAVREIASSVIGGSSLARPIVIMKIRPSAKPIQRSFPTSLVPTS